MALQLLSAVHVHDNQRVSILAACANNMQAEMDAYVYTKDYVFIKSTSYSSIAGVLLQFDTQESSRALGTFTAHAGNRHLKDRNGAFILAEVSVEVVSVVLAASLVEVA